MPRHVMTKTPRQFRVGVEVRANTDINPAYPRVRHLARRRQAGNEADPAVRETTICDRNPELQQGDFHAESSTWQGAARRQECSESGTQRGTVDRDTSWWCSTGRRWRGRMRSAPPGTSAFSCRIRKTSPCELESGHQSRVSHNMFTARPTPARVLPSERKSVASSRRGGKVLLQPGGLCELSTPPDRILLSAPAFAQRRKPLHLLIDEASYVAAEVADAIANSEDRRTQRESVHARALKREIEHGKPMARGLGDSSPPSVLRDRGSATMSGGKLVGEKGKTIEAARAKYGKVSADGDSRVTSIHRNKSTTPFFVAPAERK